MIPILYNDDEKDFLSGGIGRLYEATSCSVTERRNGDFKLSLSYPSHGKYASFIRPGRIIYADHDASGKPQAFDITRVNSSGASMSVEAEHVTYRAKRTLSARQTVFFQGPDITCQTINDSLDASDPDIVNDIGVRLSSDIDEDYVLEQLEQPAGTKVTAAYDVGESLYDLIFAQSAGNFLFSEVTYSADEQGYSVSGYGDIGDILRDGMTISFLKNRGKKSGLRLRSGETAFALKTGYDQSDAEVVSAVMPVWNGTDGFSGTRIPITLRDLDGSDPIVSIENAPGYSYMRVITYDTSSIFSSKPSAGLMRAAAQAYLRELQGKSWQGDRTYSVNVDGIYGAGAKIDACLCDEVFVEKGFDGVASAGEWEKVVEVAWDVLKGRYTSMSVGRLRPTVNQMIRKQTDDTKQQTETDDKRIQDLESKTDADVITYPTVYNPDEPADWVSGGSGGIGQQYTDSQGRTVEQIAMVNRKPIFAPVGGGGVDWQGDKINLYRIARRSLTIPSEYPEQVQAYGQVISGGTVSASLFTVTSMWLEPVDFIGAIDKTNLRAYGIEMCFTVEMQRNFDGGVERYRGSFSIPCNVSKALSAGVATVSMSTSSMSVGCVLTHKSSSPSVTDPKTAIVQIPGISYILSASTVPITTLGGMAGPIS